MAILQAIVAFIGRTVGKILSALLDWAVVSLFGRVTGTVPPGLVRTIWLAAAVLVPIAVGVTVAWQSPTGRAEGIFKSILRGFARGRHDTYIPVVTSPESYPVAAKVVVTTFQDHGIELASVEPPWWAALPSRILQKLGQGAFKGYLADQEAYFRNDQLEAVLYPNALLLRASSVLSARAHALAVEALTGHCPTRSSSSGRSSGSGRSTGSTRTRTRTPVPCCPASTT